MTPGPVRWGLGREPGRPAGLALCLFSPLSVKFVPLRSPGTRDWAWPGALGIRRLPGLPQKPERLSSERDPPEMSWA